jgi:hypothetical protein
VGDGAEEEIERIYHRDTEGHGESTEKPWRLVAKASVFFSPCTSVSLCVSVVRYFFNSGSRR